MLLIIDDFLCGKDEIKQIQKTDDGFLRIQGIIKSTVVAFAMHNIHTFLHDELKLLTRKVTEDEMQQLCSVAWSCLYQRQPGELDEFVKQVAAKLDTPEFQESRIKRC